MSSTVFDLLSNHDKENDPSLIQREILSKMPGADVFKYQGRRRHLSLVDTNTETGRIVSTTEEFGGWACVEDEKVANRSRLWSLVDSRIKHRKTSESWKIASRSPGGARSLQSDSGPGNSFSRGKHENGFIESVKVREDSPRPRFLTAIESMRKASFTESLACLVEDYEVFSENDDIYETPNELHEIVENEINRIPEDVVTIDTADDDMFQYCSEIIKYMWKLEMKFIVPHDFLERGSVSPTMRSTLVDWLIQVQHHLNLCQETLYLTVAILDQVLNVRDVDPDKLQLVGITAMLVASKLEEYYSADIKKLLHLTENSYDLRDVLRMELVLMEVLDYQLYLPSPQLFLQRCVAASLHPASTTFLSTCYYLIDSHLPSVSHSSTPPSLLAAASILTTQLLFLITTSSNSPNLSVVWTPTLRFYSGYDVEDLLVTSLSMLNMVQSTVYTGASTKYKSRHDRLVLKDHLQIEVLRKADALLESLVDDMSQINEDSCDTV